MLVLGPDSGADHFLFIIIDLIPSTARSSSSLSSALPPHLEPLLIDSLNNAISSLNKILPEVRKVNILEEAEYEPHTDGGFEQERMMQSMFVQIIDEVSVADTLRTL